jgi:hypothetical protein
MEFCGMDEIYGSPPRRIAGTYIWPQTPIGSGCVTAYLVL